MGGFEGADHINGVGLHSDMVTANGHLQHADADYARLAALGLRTVRESIGWRMAEHPGAPEGQRFDFSRALRLAEAAARHGVQILWTLMHYGLPAGVDVYDDTFAGRLADFAAAAARALRGSAAEPGVYTPINEINFYAWAIAETELFHPYRRESSRRHKPGEPRPNLGVEAKWRLVRASLRAIEAIRAEEPGARILHVEPLVHQVAPLDAPELTPPAEHAAAGQWEAWDMHAGRLMPELGGHPDTLDLLGVNYYHDGQWEFGSGRKLDWHLREPRRLNLETLLRAAWKRYRRPLVVSETSHVGSGRGTWIDEIARSVERARRVGVPVHGICLYPVIDRPDWNNPAHWHRSGTWDVDPPESATPLRRRLHLGAAKALRRAQQRLPAQPVAVPEMPHLVVFSHLRWNDVRQRPHHLIAQLAHHYQVLWVEEPVRVEGPAFFVRSTPEPGIEVLRPHTPVAAAGFHDDQLAPLEGLLASHFAEHDVVAPLVWLTTPMALPLIADLKPRTVVYDCMDDLAALQRAPRQMRQREAALLRRADLVFAAGPSLYEALLPLHPRVLLLPNGVDAAHWAATSERAPGPRPGGGRRATLGFFGVIDERVDVGLVAALADADPHWHVEMVGPIRRPEAAALPQRANLHWLGDETYDALPARAAQWDVALLPFERDAATRASNPPQALDYMAAGKPIVATVLRDVRLAFGGAVTTCEDPAAFIAACRASLAEGPAQCAARIAAMRGYVQRHAWHDIAETARLAIAAQLAGNATPLDASAATAPAPGWDGTPARVRPVDRRAR